MGRLSKMDVERSANQTAVQFGKYAGMSLLEIAKHDLSYVHWLVTLELNGDDRRNGQKRQVVDLARQLCKLKEYQRKPGATTMPFGKHQGESLDSIADENHKYLEWAMENCGQMPDYLREDIQAVLERL